MTNDVHLASLSARELREAYASGELSPVEVHDAVLERIERAEPTLNAMWQVDAKSSRDAARASEERWRAGDPAGSLDGIPMTLKENVNRRGVPVPSGCAGVTPVVPERDAPITERVLESGAVVMGSTTMPDWGMLSSGVSSIHGITRSPWDPSLTTGGSSSGAGAAAAAAYGPLHVGTDIGGSIRLPGTWLALATLKPSFGRVPLDVPFQGRVAGPMARTVGDLALLMEVITQPDVRDYTSLPASDEPWSTEPAEVEGLRVGLHLDAGCGGNLDPQVRGAIEEAARLFERAGAHIEVVEPFMTQELLDSLNLFWQVRSWNDYLALDVEARTRVLPYVANWCSKGADVSGRRILQCVNAINEIQARTVAATAPYDLVVSPVAPVAAFPAEQPMPFMTEGQGMWHINYTAPYNMTGQPAATVNCAFLPDGRAVGVQLAGRRFADREVLRAAAWFEQARPESAVPDWPEL